MGGEYDRYTNHTFNKIFTPAGPFTLDFASKLNLYKGSLFGQLSKRYLKDRLQLSLGIRTDVNTYTAKSRDPLRQLSPRFSASYLLTERLSLNGNIGRFCQLPALYRAWLPRQRRHPGEPAKRRNLYPGRPCGAWHRVCDAQSAQIFCGELLQKIF